MYTDFYTNRRSLLYKIDQGGFVYITPHTAQQENLESKLTKTGKISEFWMREFADDRFRILTGQRCEILKYRKGELIHKWCSLLMHFSVYKSILTNWRWMDARSSLEYSFRSAHVQLAWVWWLLWCSLFSRHGTRWISDRGKAALFQKYPFLPYAKGFNHSYNNFIMPNTTDLIREKLFLELQIKS